MNPHTKVTSLGWLSDLHLDMACESARKRFLQSLKSSDCDAAIVTGDTSAFPKLEQNLIALAKALAPRPVYFLIGNHECYYSSIESTYALVRKICRKVSNLHHLQDTRVVWLNRHTVLIGHHGWADARTGWGPDTVIRCKDHSCIEDFRGLSRAGCFELMEKLGKDSACAIRMKLQPILGRARKVIIATHFPPFQSSARFDDEVCGPTHNPFYVNASLGGFLISLARHNPKTRYLVLCGHTHHPARDLIIGNLECHVAGSVPGKPKLHALLSINAQPK